MPQEVRGLRPAFKFQLHRHKDSDTILLIQDLKSRQRFVPSIRDGLRLIDDLWHGNIDVLLELFPWVADAIFNRLKKDSRELEDVLAMQQELMIQLEMLQTAGFTGHSGPTIKESAAFELVAATAPIGDDFDDMLDAF